MRSLTQFYQTAIYNTTRYTLQSNNIRLIPHATVSGAPAESAFLSKLYVNQFHKFDYGRIKYQIHFSVFLHDADIHRLNALNLYDAFKKQTLWVQSLYFPVGRRFPRYQICRNFITERWWSAYSLRMSLICKLDNSVTECTELEITAMASCTTRSRCDLNRPCSSAQCDCAEGAVSRA